MRFAILAVALTLAARAHAAPAPAKPVGPEFFTGRWFEIARSPNPNQKDCQAPTYEFTPQAAGGPRFTLTCRKGSPSGPADRLAVRVRLPKGEDLARFRVTALGGIVGADYTVLDHDEAYGWALLTMGEGQYVWLLARQPALDGPTRAALAYRIAALGYDTRGLIFPRF
jgi:apolipoprotein D and lipocalin family protein